MKKTQRKQSPDRRVINIAPYHLPMQFELLCKALNLPIEKILYDFMNCLCGEGFKSSSDNQLRTKAVEYFIQCGYGSNSYTEQQIRQMLKELDAISMLWPENAADSIILMHANWRNKYYDYWTSKWKNS